MSLLQAHKQNGDFVAAYFVAGHNYTVADDNICRGDDDDDDDNMIIIIIFIETMLDLIFVEVESFMQLLSEIYGYLFEHVKRTCMALSDPSIYAELCNGFLSVWKRAASHFSACTHFLS